MTTKTRDKKARIADVLMKYNIFMYPPEMLDDLACIDDLPHQEQRKKRAFVLPDGSGALILLDKLNDARRRSGMNRIKGYKTQEMVERVNEAHKRLNGRFDEAITYVLGQGVLDLKSAVNIVCKYGTGSNGKSAPRSAGVTSLPVSADDVAEAYYKLNPNERPM